MTCHRAYPCKGLRKGLAKVRARVSRQISAALQGLQRFRAILSHVYVRACAPAHARWVTRNPCNPCYPCTSEQEVTDFRHSLSDDGARVAQGLEANPQGFAGEGGGSKSANGSVRRPQPLSYGDFFPVEADFQGQSGAYKGKAGRPFHKPSIENRIIVKHLADAGWTQQRIAAAVGVSHPTLRRHYFSELGSRAGAARHERETANDRS